MNELRGHLVLPKVIEVVPENNATVLYGTTEEWESADGISDLCTFYIYTDYYTDKEGKKQPALKAGDGVSLISELPFMAGSGSGSVTPEDRDTWNNKVSVNLDKSDPETLSFRTSI